MALLHLPSKGNSGSLSQLSIRSKAMDLLAVLGACPHPPHQHRAPLHIKGMNMPVSLIRQLLIWECAPPGNKTIYNHKFKKKKVMLNLLKNLLCSHG